MTTTLLTFGTFDCVHAGHAAFLRRCERFADHVVVAVRSDPMVHRLRGHLAEFNFAERESLVLGLGPYRVVKSIEAGRAAIEAIDPDVLAVGSDWARRDVLGRYEIDHDYLDAHSIALLYLPYTPNISTTILKERLGG
jgi:glycerol-3-phosphate cytidylyltransferase